MAIDIKQLEETFNLHCLQPNFVNLELHYIIASDEKTFRFATWDEEQQAGEEKFYCFLSEEELFIPAGNIRLKQSYVLTQEPVYPLIANATNFETMMETVLKTGVAKGVRRFNNEAIETIRTELCDKFGDCEKHVVTSAEAQHQLFVVKDVEISISATMVYFRLKAPISESHYNNVKE